MERLFEGAILSSLKERWDIDVLIRDKRQEFNQMN